jgi:ferredoxin
VTSPRQPTSEPVPESAAPARWRLEIDTERCQGSGVCVGLAPEYFSFGPDRKSRVRRPLVADEDIAAAAECCPAEAIILTGLEPR